MEATAAFEQRPGVQGLTRSSPKLWRRWTTGPVDAPARDTALSCLALVLLVVINLMTSPGEWWVRWAALGLVIAWLINLITILRTAVLAGGVAALAAYLSRRSRT